MIDVRDRHLLTEFRIRAITIGLNVSWIVVGVLVIEGIRLGVLTEPPARAATIGLALTLAAFNFVKWTAAINRFTGKLLLWLWGIVMLAALGAALSIEELAPATLGLYLALIALAASLSQVARQQDELTRKDVNFERLYEVSQTISAGDSLENVLPELVGRIGTYLDCEVGVVLLRNESGTSLEVLSPIWAAGHSLEVAGYRIGLQTRDPLVKASVTQNPMIITDIDVDPDEQGILGELGLASAMVVSLQVERRPMGLMVVGDKQSGPFTAADLRDFVSLAAPAALVLSQLDRYKEAAETSRRMEDLARMKTDFVSVVSHELRTPLTSIIGALATLARPELAPEREAARELLASAQEQTNRLRRLIEDLLIVSRIENRSLPQQAVEIQLHSFLAGVVAEIPDAGELVTIRVHERVDQIEADSDHLHRILINLVENAIKYGNGTDVEVSATPRAGGQLSIAVADHGPGITEAQRKAVFERFTQLAPAATRAQGGTGLGLHIVKGLVEVMGGRIELTDTPGGGATFNVILPRAPGSLPVTSIRVLKS